MDCSLTCGSTGTTALPIGLLPWIEFPFVTAQRTFDHRRGGFFERKSDIPTRYAEFVCEKSRRQLNVREIATLFRYSPRDPTREFSDRPPRESGV
jgi:hypothetical protein